MRKLTSFTFLLALVLMLWSCEKENMDPIGNWELTEPIPTAPDGNATVVLDEENPTVPVVFEWAEAVSSANYQVRYTIVLDSAGSEEFTTPIFQMSSGDGGKNLTAAPAARLIDQALSIAGYSAGETIGLRWAVIAKSLDKMTVSYQDVSIKRFLTESAPLNLFIAGSATEAGTDVSQAIPMKSFKDGDGNPTGVFEIYTSLEASESFTFYSEKDAASLKFGGSNGTLSKNGPGITASESGTYRITVDFNTNTYSLLKIDKWSVVGDIITGGWGGDEPLEYIGNSTWQGSIDLTQPAGFIFRANGDWAYLLKRIVGTPNQLVMESHAASQGLSFEDIPSSGVGPHIFTLNLAASGYNYSIEVDNSVGTPAETPEQLFLLSNGEMISEFTKEGDVFKSVKYVALQESESYTLNSESDGSGTNYSLTEAIGTTDNPNGDAVVESMEFGTGAGSINIIRDQAYQLTVNFTTGLVSWKYYNIKLFHWDDPNGGWDARDELVMAYVHPHTFTLDADLSAGFDLKFISPWDIDMGGDDPAALAGTATNKGGSNIKNITESGAYTVTLEVADDYSVGTYEFVKK